MKVIAFLQARTDSTRLLNKVLKDILGKPMIIHQLERTKKSKNINKIVLVTSEESNDDELANIVIKNGYDVYRGSKDNVLERFYNCAVEYNLNDNDTIVRLTGDCPVHDAEIIDELIDAFKKSGVDYMANCVEPVYPDGLDAEVFTFKALEQAYLNASKPSEKEHVTPYIRNSGLFKVENLQNKPIHPEWRLTVDEPNDFKVIEHIYNYFGNNNFSFNNIVAYLEANPEILNINSKIKRNEGYKKSLREDVKEI